MPETHSVEGEKLAGELKARDVSQGRHFHPRGRAGRLAAIRWRRRRDLQAVAASRLQVFNLERADDFHRVWLSDRKEHFKFNCNFS